MTPTGRRRPFFVTTLILPVILAPVPHAHEHEQAPAILAPGPVSGAELAAPAQESQAALQDDPLGGWTFSGTLEGFYEWNFNRPPDRVNLLRAYDARANTFALQQVALLLERAPRVDQDERFGLRVDLQFGSATDTVQGNPANEPRPETYRHVWQAFGSYVFPIGRGVRVDFGKFASNLGYETNYAKDDDHFSRAYLFNFLPFYHSGLRTTVPLTDKLTFMHMLTNGVQQTEDFNDFKSNHFVAILAPVPHVTWTINYYFGQEQPDAGQPAGPDGYFRVFDTYVTYKPMRAMSFGVDLNRVTNEVTKGGAQAALFGLGAYARYQLTAPAAVAFRFERLDDDGGLFGGVQQLLHEATFTSEYKLADGFFVRAELRRDWSDRNFFTGSRPDILRSAQHTALVGLVWWAGGKKGTW